jgi:ActR/RegA family two-component response regulator
MGKPGDPGLIAIVRESAPDARIVVYSGYVSLMGAGELANGADAYLDKADDEGKLVETIRGVYSST